MKKTYFPLLLIFLALLTYSCDDKKEPKVTPPTRNNTGIEDDNSDVLQFIYDGMSTYYLWADDMINKKPKTTQKPDDYFRSVLSKLDIEHGWSYVTDDAEALKAGLSGDPVSFGFSVIFDEANKEKKEFYAIVKYVFPNTPASDKGLKRLDFIGEIDGEPVTDKNYHKLFGSKSAKFNIYNLTEEGISFVREISMTPRKINTNPVLLDTVYTDQKTGKKIAYLFYTDFLHDFNNNLYEAFSKFKSQGVSDLILDLRYNHGGRTSAACYLASLIAPENAVKERAPFIKFSYNDFLNDMFDKNNWSRTDSLGVFDPSQKDPLGANLNLNKVYIIATSDSYSASELTTFCLKDYMDVVHIGGKTGGKFTASWTLHPYDDEIGLPIYDESKLSSAKKAKLKNWAMQPIVAFYANSKEENFSIPGYLEPQFEVREGDGYISNWTELGDIKDTYLAKALFEITGNSDYMPARNTNSMSRMKRISAKEEIRLDNPLDVSKKSVIMDPPKVQDQKELFELIRNRKK